MNFFASQEYLQVLADVYFPGKPARVADVRIGGQVLRLLILGDRQVVTEMPFLDYHQPLRADEIGRAERRRAYAPWVAREVVGLKDRHPLPEGLGTAPYIDWSLFSSYDDYLASLRARHNDRFRELRRLRRRLAEHFGPLEFLADDTRPDVLERALDWKGRQFRETGQGDVFAYPENFRFFEELRRRDLLVASTLRGAGRLLAVSLGFIHQGVWSGWIMTYDHAPELKAYSVGNQLLQEMLAHSFAARHREFDFSIGDQDFKWLYATHARVLGPLGPRPWRLPRLPPARAVVRGALDRAGLLGVARSLRNALRAMARL